MKREAQYSNDENNLTSKSADRPISQIMHDILNHVTEIFRSEFRLARAEVRQDLAPVREASLFLAAGAVFGLYALGFVLLGGVYLIATALPLWISALIVGIGAGIVAALFLQIGRTKMRKTTLKPDKTIRSLEENVQWMKRQAR